MTRHLHAQTDALNAQSRSLRERASRDALALAERAYEAATAANDTRGIVESLINQSHCHTWLSNFTAALSHAIEALNLQSVLGDQAVHADALLALSRVHLKLSNFTESIDAADSARRLAEECADVELQADACNLIGINCYRLERHDRALESYDMALHLYRQIAHSEGICKVCINIAQSHIERDSFDTALVVINQAVALAKTAQSPMLEAYGLLTFSQVVMHQDAYESAQEGLQRALALTVDIGNHHLELAIVLTIGSCYLKQRCYTQSLEYLHRALDRAIALDNHFYLARCHELLSQYYEEQGEWKSALAHYKQFYQMNGRVFNEVSVHRFQTLEILHQVEQARQKAAIYQQQNVALEQEIVDRKRLESELQYQATTDALTNTANRRRFIEVANIEVQRAIRHHRPLSIALIDLDFLKSLNDTYGHAIGDSALLRLSQIFQRHIRAIDTFARLGGDEFALLMPDTAVEHAFDTAERIRGLLANYPWTLESGNVNISVSIGITGLLDRDDTLETLLGRADRALYMAKGRGRNCVMRDPT